MNFSFDAFKSALSEAEEWLKKELTSIRTGQATPAVLDSITVESYGSRLPLAQVATITLDGPRGLRVSVWDKGTIKAIESAIRERDLGLSVSADEAGVRVFFPEVTEEQKLKFVKLAKERLEEARVRVKKAREDVSSLIQKSQKDGDVSEDEAFRLRGDMQKLVDTSNETLLGFFAKKEKEILSV